jgi:hypothetical protein
MKRTALLCLFVLAACSAPIDYRPNPESLHGLSRPQREQVFVETISRAIKPRIFQVWIDDVSYGHDDGRVVRGAFGEPLGIVPRRRIIYFVNIGHLQLFTNNAVFVYDTSGRVVDKLVFSNVTDAQYTMDVIEGYRAMRVDPREFERRRRRDDHRDRPYREDDRDPHYRDDDRNYDRRYEFDDRD